MTWPVASYFPSINGPFPQFRRQSATSLVRLTEPSASAQFLDRLRFGEVTLSNIEKAIKTVEYKGIPVIHIQHIANPEMGIAPFFNQGTEGAAIHPRIIQAAPDAPVVVKEFADRFVDTYLEEVLSDLSVTDLRVWGMMTQNCVTHTAISKSAGKHTVSILPDCCTTVDEMIHNIALHPVSTRIQLVPSTEAI